MYLCTINDEDDVLVTNQKSSSYQSPVLVNGSRTTTGQQDQLMFSMHSLLDNALSPHHTANI